jgi:SAM-dependent methyltransferase
MFDGHYDHWRHTRITKLISILGEEWFRDKKVLELGCGYAHIGNVLHEYGADVTVCDGREEHIEVVKNSYPHLKSLVVDQTQPYFVGKFDLVIHWGVMYHLPSQYWKQDLSCAVKHGNLISLETEVSDSSDPSFFNEPHESGYDQSMHSTGFRPSPNMVEEEISSLGFVFDRYDDSDLNSGTHIYDWKIEETKSWKSGLRRFWMIRK